MGNHAIAAIEIPKDYSSPKLRSVVTLKSGHRYLIFDPTWEKTAFGQLENNLQGSYGELVDGQNSEIVQLPVLSPELNMVNRSATFELRPDGSIAGSIVEKRFGDLSEYDRSLTQRPTSRSSSANSPVLSAGTSSPLKFLVSR